MTATCLRCSATYDAGRRRASHFCPACRIERKQDADRERSAKRRATAAEIRSDVHEWIIDRGDLDGLEAQHEMYPAIDDYVATVDATERGLVPDRMPTGSNSPAGPDEGHSTFFKDLGEDLDRHAAEVAQRPWFAANPHWAYELHDENRASEYLEAA